MRDNHFSFERMIDPIGEGTFLREYWDQKPLVIERGKPDYYAGVLSMADIDAIVGFRQLKYSQLKIARAEQVQPDKVFYVDSDRTSDTNRLFHSYDQGDTVALNFAQCYWEPAARLCAALESFFHFPAGVNVYVTPRNSGISSALRCTTSSSSRLKEPRAGGSIPRGKKCRAGWTTPTHPRELLGAPLGHFI
jgi:hypothetical protein